MIFERTDEEVFNNLTKGLFNYYCSIGKFEKDSSQLKNDAVYIASKKDPFLLNDSNSKKDAYNALVSEYNRFAVQDKLKNYYELKPSGIIIYLKQNDGSYHTGPVYNSVIHKIEKTINGTGKAVMMSAVVHSHNNKCTHIHVMWKYIKGKRCRNKVIESIDELLKNKLYIDNKKAP